MYELYRIIDVGECKRYGSGLLGIKLRKGLLFVGIARRGGGAIAVGGNSFYGGSVEVVCSLCEGDE